MLNTDLAVHHVFKFTCIKFRCDAGSMSRASLPRSVASALAHAIHAVLTGNSVASAELPKNCSGLTRQESHVGRPHP